MNKTLSGTVTISLGNDKIELKPTLDAVRRIEHRFGGLSPALDALQKLSVDGTSSIIAAGAGLKGEKESALPARVFAAGVVDIVPEVIRFVGYLLRPTYQEESEKEAGKPPAATIAQ